ncbi:MAG: shikimate dehydrogenase [Candidatus Stahlbacteria bacterium]|nr:shikimate dehydrogenase [Candidatus Stahlbacteria bacterium]
MRKYISGKTKVYGIIGNPVIHSLSPIMHNVAFREIGLDCVYLTFKVEPKNLESAINGIKSLGIAGVNVTAPFKTEVIPHLNELKGDAKKVGTVNTIVNRNGWLIGYNTDGEGFLRSLEEDFKVNIKGKNILLIGAGGTAMAIAWTVSKTSPSKIIITNRTKEKAEELASRISASTIPFNKSDLEDILSETDILINTIPISLSLDSIGSRHFVYDIVYSNKPLLESAKKKGAKIGEGTSMLLYQGVISFELWTGKKAPIEVMRKQIIKFQKTVMGKND